MIMIQKEYSSENGFRAKNLPNHLIHEPWKINFIEEKDLNFNLSKNYCNPIIDNNIKTKIAKDRIWKIKKEKI